MVQSFLYFEQEFDDLPHTPKHQKLQMMSRYIYQMLFIKGRDSGLTLNTLNREWKLHKVTQSLPLHRLAHNETAFFYYTGSH
jgi:hypothetical protein